MTTTTKNFDMTPLRFFYVAKPKGSARATEVMLYPENI
jgi:hypothetical protein